ncbi:hypothetical protein STENM223S_05311 [Streptomyces tendae]
MWTCSCTPYSPGCCAERNRHCICCNARPEERLHEAHPRLAVLLAAAVVAATACAPQTSDNSSSGEDEKSGTLRVWLFQEVNNKPKEKVVDAVLAGFEKAHEDTEVTVEYIPVETRAQRIKAAFNDPKSAPDVIEYGNTDTAGYVKDGGLPDVTEDFDDWNEAKDTDPTARLGHRGREGLRRALLRRRPRPVLPHRRLQGTRPRSARDHGGTGHHRPQDRAAKPNLYRLAVGGAYTYGAMPFLWANGGELATGKGGSYASAIAGADAHKGIKAYTSLFTDDNCPAAKCAGMGGTNTITAFASGKAAMAIGGDFSHQAVEAGQVKGKYAVVSRCPAPSPVPSPPPSPAATTSAS